MKSLKDFGIAGPILAVVLLLLSSTSTNGAFDRPNKSGCEGRVRRTTGVAGTTAEWNVYEWPDKSSKVLTTVKGTDPPFWVYVDYESPFYLVSVCARAAGAKCQKGDNLDNNPANDPIVGFMERRAVDTLSYCHNHDPKLPDGHYMARKKFNAGPKYIVSARELYLRSVEPGNQGHPYGLLRKDNVFVKEKVSDNGEWMYGWALGGSRGVNSKMRYGKVAYSDGRYLRADSKKK